MKKTLVCILVPLFFFSCHKPMNKGEIVTTCGGYFIGAGVAIRGGSSTIPGSGTFTLFTINVGTNKVVDSYKNSIQVGNLSGIGALGVYDHVHKNYYLYGWGDATHGVLYSFNTDTGSAKMLGYPVFDSVHGNYFFSNLFCNSAAGKLYFFGGNDSTFEIYEVSPGGPNLSQKLVYTLTTYAPISAPVINENNGCIYFIWDYNLVKVDPRNGASTVVANYSNTLVPDQLQYNSNDGMFYGVNIYNYNPSSYPFTPANFIRINPNNGDYTSLAAVAWGSYSYAHSPTAFDFCDNLYVVFGQNSTYWLDPSSGKVVQQSGFDNGDYFDLACINKRVP